MTKIKLLLISSWAMIFPLHSTASNYYWVGGTGNYSDVSHWATTSGGSTFQSVAPTNYDDVFFDVNSFPASGDTVYFDVDYSGAHYFTTAGVLNNPTFADGPAALRIDIQGNFSVTPNVNWISACELAFTPLGPDSILTIQTNSIYIPNQVIIDGDPSSSIILLDALSCNNIDFEGGNFYSSNNDLNCSSAFYHHLTTLFLGTSTITSNAQMDFLGNGIIYSDSATFVSSNFNVNNGISGLHFGTVIAPYISADESYFKVALTPNIIGTGNNVELMMSDTIWINEGVNLLGPNIFSKVIALNAVSISWKAVIDTLIFTAPGVDFGLPDTLTITGEIVMTNTPAKPGSIAQAFGDSCHLFKANGTVCFDFVSFSNVHAIGGAQFFAGYNSIDNGGNSGLQFTGCTTAGGVWPGDANYDLTVDNMDILAIGLANGETGPTRAGASNSWVEQPVTDWASTFASGINMKHADCDGNGLVDASDTSAVSINYGMHHPAVRLIAPRNIPTSNSLLTIDVTPDTVGPSTPVHINIDLGIDSIYGIAFSVYYDPALINSNSLIPDFSNSWLGTSGVNMIGFAKADPVAGRIDFALTRTDHTDAIAGAGHLISFDLITASNIPVASSLTMEADNVNGVFLAQNFEVIAGSSDSTFVDSTVSIHRPVNSVVNLSANIKDNSILLNYYSHAVSEINILVSDITGRILLVKEIKTIVGVNRNEIEVGNIDKGVYVVAIRGAGGKESLKVVKE